MEAEACVGAVLENGTPMILGDLRHLPGQPKLGTPSELGGRQDFAPIDLQALATFHPPLKERWIVAPGSSRNVQNQRRSLPPALQGGAPSQPRSHSRLRLACARAVVCGVRLRPRALRFAVLLLLPLTTASRTRWRADMGSHCPPPAQRLRPLLPHLPGTAGSRDGSAPLGTDHWGRGGKAEPDRLLAHPGRGVGAGGRGAARGATRHRPWPPGDRGLRG